LTDEAAGLERRVVLGRIRGAFGVRGWVKVQSYTNPPANILKYPIWQVGRAGAWEALELEEGRVTAKGVLAKLASIDTPEEARLRIGTEIAVPRGELPPTEPGEYYWHDLEGLEAVSKSGQPLGRVDHFRSVPAGTVIVVTGEREHWVPFVKERIVQVELEAGRIVLDWEPDW
jgi:16S rRNA processing protein RimM